MGSRISVMFPRTRSISLTHRIAAMFMTLALLVAGQAVHMPMAQADADAGASHAMGGHASDGRGLDIGHETPPGEQMQSETECVGTECGSCAASMAASSLGPPPLHDTPPDHAVIDSAVRPPERLFRPPIRLS